MGSFELAAARYPALITAALSGQIEMRIGSSKSLCINPWEL